ncbi:hypothetical protein D3C78_1204710 [compost metagenome]
MRVPVPLLVGFAFLVDPLLDDLVVPGDSQHITLPAVIQKLPNALRKGRQNLTGAALQFTVFAIRRANSLNQRLPLAKQGFDPVAPDVLPLGSAQLLELSPDLLVIQTQVIERAAVTDQHL